MNALLHHFERELSDFSPKSGLLKALEMSEALSHTYEYWSDKRGDRPAPLESELCPHIDIPIAARQITLVDVETVGNGRRFHMRPRHRVRIGNGVSEYIDERLSGSILDRTLEASNNVCDTGSAQFIIIDPTIDFPYFYCRLCVPVTRDGSAIDVQIHAVDVLSPYDR